MSRPTQSEWRMIAKVRVSRHKLDYFRKLARNAHPLEIQAYLIGKVISPQLTAIEEFAYTKNYASQTVGEVSWYVADYEKVKRKAEERGLRIVGDIHSHPNWDAVMSKADYQAHIEDG